MIGYSGENSQLQNSFFLRIGASVLITVYFQPNNVPIVSRENNSLGSNHVYTDKTKLDVCLFLQLINI
jgi:hypothetical protein